MSRYRQVILLARREFIQRAKSRAFLVTMAIIVVVVVLAGPIILLLQDEEKPIDIGLVGSEPTGLESGLDEQATAFDVEVTITRFRTIVEAEEALNDESIDVVLVDASELVWHKDESLRTATIVTGAVAAAEQRVVMEELGLTDEEMIRLVAPTQMTQRTLVAPDPEEEPRQIAAFVGTFILYVSIIVFGQFVAVGTVEEKQNRVVEVVLSRVKPAQVLVGKVLGIGALGLTQLLVLAATVAVVVSIIEIPDVSLPSLGAEIIGGVIFWFLLGYTLYAFINATLGATVSRQEDLGSVAVLPTLLVLPGFFIAVRAIESPDLLVVRLASFFPPWAPMVMPVRSAVGNAPFWEVALSVVLVLAAIYLLVRIGARVYTGALLRTGGKVKLREAWKAARN
ncbi:MAG: ABC transporter permease [Acidobacteria bacterium]|nr:ABC transporter permease [Acidobacteriota bacterium]